MAKRIAIFGGSFNPAGTHHRRVVEALSMQFDEVLVIPCGPRPDKATTNDIEPIHRAVMADMAFRGIANAKVETFDLENATFTRTHELEELYRVRNEVWHIIGSDFVQGGRNGESKIHKEWANAQAVWRDFRFAVVERDGYPFEQADLPPKHLVFKAGPSGSSEEIRSRVNANQSVEGLVSSEVEAYIERYRLYRGSVLPKERRISLPDPKPLIVFDEKNEKATALAARFGGFATTAENANCILAIGGDGTMLHAIREHWRLRLPFIGLNMGHRGYLLNRVDENELQDPLALFVDLRAYQLPQLRVDFTDFRGTPYSQYAFNDAWVERRSGQCAWLKVTVDGRVRMGKFVGDGLLVSTPSGSTAYARTMGGSLLPIDTQVWQLVGSHVHEPLGWKCLPLSPDSEVLIESLDYSKRPIRAFVDGREWDELPGLRVRMSKVASVELAFLAHHDMNEKFLDEVFPAK